MVDSGSRFSLVQFGLYRYIALNRFIDRDEGFSLLASRLVLANKKPYLDFFFQQAPLLPYVYALWMKVAGVTWVSARMFAGVLTAILGTLLFEHVKHVTKNWSAAFCAVVLFASSTQIFAWFLLAKVYSLAGLLLFASYVVLSRIGDRHSKWVVGFGGLLLGLSIDTRSYLILILPFFVWWLVRNSGTKVNSSVWWLLGGVLAGNIPAIYFFLSSPRAFLFNNLGYHLIRSDGGAMGMWTEKIFALLLSLLGGPGGNGIQLSLLLLISWAFVFSVRDSKYPPRFAFEIGVAVMFISLLPTPVIVQYFSLAVPFFIACAVCVLSGIYQNLTSTTARTFGIAAGIILIIVYIGVSVPDFKSYLFTGNDVPGVSSAKDPADWKIDRVIEVSETINKIVGSGQMAVAFWPGDIFQTDAAPLSGTENDWSMPVASKLSADQKLRFHVLSAGEIEDAFARREPRVVVLRDLVLSPDPPEKGLARVPHRTWNDFKVSLLSHGYTVARIIGGISIYVRNQN